MPQFDTKTFFELTGRGNSPVQALGTAFGMPSCLINLGAQALSILPSPLLNAIRGSTANGAARANDVMKAFSNKLRSLGGIIEYDTEDGIFRFISDSSKNGLDRNGGGITNILGGFLGAAGAAAGFAGRLYNNYNTTLQQIRSVEDCLQSYKDYLDFTENSADKKAELSALNPSGYQQMLLDRFSADLEEVENARAFRDAANQLTRNIDSIIAQRLRNPELEPEFTDDYFSILSGTPLQVSEPEPQVDEEIFRLEYGPPISKQGKFILSVDGLYYDSQTAGIVPALMELERRKSSIPANLQWKLDYDPNIGGRGRPTSLNDIKSYVNTVLDPAILDESDFLQGFYQEDNLLQSLIGQKNRKIFDVSTTLANFESSGVSQALIANLRQVMLSEASHFTDKINKRKKQIELAVKLPVIYTGIGKYSPGNIPVNDFSYLEGINFLVDVEKQRKIVLEQDDVASVVLPLQVKFTQQIDSGDDIILEHLLINNIAEGTVITNPSGLDIPTLSINNSVISENLIALYNCLTAKTDSTSSVEYRLHNSSEEGADYNAQIVGNPESIFDKGLGIVYLHGITKRSADDSNISSSIGSYIKLPPKTKLQDFIYNKTGATFETWVHVPQLDGARYGFNEDDNASGLYRLILANENTGIGQNASAQPDILNMQNDDGTSFVNGLIFGFTRDRRFTQSLSPSNTEASNRTDNMCLILAPTQSYDASSVGFISKSFDVQDVCYGTPQWYGMTIDVWDTINGVCLSSAGREFVQLSVTFNPPKDRIEVYMDGTLLAASSYRNVFGKDARYGTPNIPSLKKTNSFEYNSNYMSSTGNSDLKAGPLLDEYFTPWILGGGYTDGNPNGNFMGGEYGGQISGLKGYLGCIRFYSKPLTQDQILHNYDATKDFFKNIEVPNLMWEPINIV